MKILFTAAFLITFTSLTAQTGDIKLRKGQKIQATATSEVEADFGMGMPMKNNTEAINVIVVNDEKDGNYLLTNTLDKVKVKMEFMGQTQRFDSENDHDKETELGKQMGPLVGQPFNVSLSKSTGQALSETKEESDQPASDPLRDVLGGSGDEGLVSSAFFKIPKGKKKGETWIVNDSTSAGKSKYTYTITRMINNIADISFTSVLNVVKPMESQGQEMLVTMTVNSNGTFTTDTETGMVSKRTTETEIKGNIEVMDQTMPITATSTQVIIFLSE